jgi:hypothetical protein
MRSYNDENLRNNTTFASCCGSLLASYIDGLSYNPGVVLAINDEPTSETSCEYANIRSVRIGNTVFNLKLRKTDFNLADEE